MKNGAAILKVLSAQKVVLLKMIKMAFYWERICEYEPKTTPSSLELLSFFKQLAGLIEEHLDLGPSTDRQFLRSTYLHMSLPKSPTLVEPKCKKFALMPSNCVETFRC